MNSNDMLPVTFKTGEEPEFRKPDHDPHGETFASAAHVQILCGVCDKLGLVTAGLADQAAYSDQEIVCRECYDNAVSQEEGEQEASGGKSDATPTESVQALPCLTCEYPSADSPCPRCGRHKW